MKIKSSQLVLLLLLGYSNQAVIRELQQPELNEELSDLVTLNEINDMTNPVNLAQVYDDVDSKYSNPYFNKAVNTTKEIKPSLNKWQSQNKQQKQSQPKAYCKQPAKPPSAWNCNPGNTWAPPCNNPWDNACEIVAAEGFQSIEVSSVLLTATGPGVTNAPVPTVDRYSATLGNLLLNNIPSTNPNLLSKVGAWSPFIYNAQIKITDVVAPLPTLAQPGSQEWIEFTFKKQVNILGVRIQGLDNTASSVYDFGRWSKWFVTWNDIPDHTMKTFSDAGWTQDTYPGATPYVFAGPNDNASIATQFFFKQITTNLIRISVNEFVGNRPFLRIGLIVSEDSGLCKSQHCCK